MRQVIKHRDIRLLNMIRRTDPVIPKRCEQPADPRHRGRRMADYPLPVWLKEGVSVNTDNMTVSNTTVSRELQLLYDACVITARDAETMVYNAISHAFASDELKAELTARARRIMTR